MSENRSLNVNTPNVLMYCPVCLSVFVYDPNYTNYCEHCSAPDLKEVFPANILPLFRVDTANSDMDAKLGEEGDFVLEVGGLGSINVKVTKEGISVDVFPLGIVADGPIASIWVDNVDLIEEAT